MKQYIGLIRDHSNSMFGLHHAAMQDYNELIRETKESFITMDTKVSVVECGVGRAGEVRTILNNADLRDVSPIRNYECSGYSTPLFDSVGRMIQLLEAATMYEVDKDYGILLIVVTDGQENSSRAWYAHNLSLKIKQLQTTDRWTFVFRVPKGYKKDLVNKLGIFENNVVEWEQSEAAYNALTGQTTSALRNYGQLRSSGFTSTSSFYSVSPVNLTTTEVKNNLTDISSKVSYYGVPKNAGFFEDEIRPYVENRLGLRYEIGTVYYQLSKRETIQANKKILIKNVHTTKTYTGDDAKQLLGLPVGQSIKVSPGNFGDWLIFIQSNSVNRKLVGGTQIAIYKY